VDFRRENRRLLPDVSVRGVKDHYELEQQQNGAEDNPHVEREPCTFRYLGRYPKPVRLQRTSVLCLMIIQIITPENGRKAEAVIR
jgi:hypothetical protein